MVILKTCEQTSITRSNSEQYTWKLRYSGQINILKKFMVKGHLDLS